MELFKKRNIVNEIIDEAMDINNNSKHRKFRLWVTPKIFKQINKLADSYTISAEVEYRKSGVTKSNGNTDYGIKTFTIMGLTFYISIDYDIKDFKLVKVNDKI